jgi:hypothetical protein
MVSSSSVSGSVSETSASSQGSAVIKTDGPAASQKLTMATSLLLSGPISEITMSSSSGGYTVVKRGAVHMSTTSTLSLPFRLELKMFLRLSGSNSFSGTGLVAVCSEKASLM